MAKFGFDVRSPIAYIKFPAEWQEQDLRSFYDEFGEALQRRRIRGELWDLSGVNPLFSSAVERKQISECVKKIAPLLSGVVLVAGRVVPSGVVRGVVTAVDWLTGSYEHPVKNFATHVEAERFVVDKLIAARIPVPDGARRHTQAWPEARSVSSHH
jgi:hypothetical protein